MILQTLDIKDNCKGIFHKNQFIFNPGQDLMDEYDLCWKHSPILDDEKFEYLHLRLRGDDLSPHSPDADLYGEYMTRLSSHAKAATTAKIDLTEECFFDLLPEHQLTKWFKMREQALYSLHKTTKREDDYDILHKAHVLTSEIAHQDLIFEGKKGRVQYDIFGSATGRLTTKKGSVPIMTLKKKDRYKITPQNDAFVELDLNAAEIRTLMALSGREQPQEDIHEWVVENVFNGEVERSKAKVELFAWLYNPSSSKSQFDKFFSRQIFRDFFAPENQTLKTPFGRVLEVDERKAQNYLLQSTTSDIVIQNAYKIMKMLKGKKSKIAFTLHDSIIIDMCKKDAIMLGEIKDQFEDTPWGPFVSTCKVGKTFGALKDLKI
jgi:hypothetical protein